MMAIAAPIKGASEMIAPDGEHLAHLLALVIQQNMTVFDFLQMPFYHPTVEEGLRTALRGMVSQVNNKHHENFELLICEYEQMKKRRK
jgi:dihydrolipoamide dehydrogenase